jgi:hypothetical protein
MPPLSPSKFDLEERTYTFAKNVQTFVKRVPKTIWNVEYAKQLTLIFGAIIRNVQQTKKKD